MSMWWSNCGILCALELFAANSQACFITSPLIHFTYYILHDDDKNYNLHAICNKEWLFNSQKVITVITYCGVSGQCLCGHMHMF